MKVNIGGFEEIILTMVANLKEEAYGALIAEEIETRLKRTVSLSAVHITLYRLQDKGFVKSSFTQPTNERGGRRKRVYKLTAAGLATLNARKEQHRELWEMIPHLKPFKA